MDNVEQDDLWGIGNPRSVSDWLRDHLEGEPTKDRLSLRQLMALDQQWGEKMMERLKLELENRPEGDS